MTKSFNEKHLAVAKVYAEALLELAEGQGTAEALGEELADLAGQIERDEQFRAFLQSPLVDASKRRDAIESLFRGRLSDLLVDGLQIMNRKRRLALLPTVAQVYHAELDRHLGRVEVEVTTAVPLDGDQRRRIEEAVATHLGKKPILRESVDASLIGGIVFQIGDRKIDETVATLLHTLSGALRTRASREHAETYIAS